MIGQADFEAICALVHREAAIVLDDGSRCFVERRLAELARTLPDSSAERLLAAIRRRPSTALRRAIVDQLTVNETRFFRDANVFAALAEHVLPAMLRNRRGLRIWSAAASSGQEAYSIAMTIHEVMPSAVPASRIIATDLSRAMCDRIAAATYTTFELKRGLSDPRRDRYFERAGEDWRVVRELRAIVEPSRVNLVGEWPALGTVDIVFLRNVLVYFDHMTRREVLARMRRILAPDGVLVLGATEAPLDIPFTRVAAGGAWLFRPVPGECP